MVSTAGSPTGSPSRRPRLLERADALARLFQRPLTSYYLLLGTTSLLVLLGLVMVLSASSVTSFESFGSSFYFFWRQLAWVACGVPLMVVAARLPVRAYRMLAYPLLLGSLLLLVLVLVPGIGVTVNGNRNWIAFGGPFRIQPSELAKLALVLWGADLFARKYKLLDQWKHMLVPLVPTGFIVIGLVIFGRDVGTSVILFAILLSLLWIAGAPLRLFGAMVGLIAVGSVYLIRAEQYRLERVSSFWDPFSDYYGSGWQAAQSIFALSTGGWFGVGLGASREKWGQLPEAHTDFIFAIIGEELGLAGTLTVLTLFAAVGYAGLRIAVRSRDPFVRLTAGGATAWLLVQAMVNVGAVLGVLPVTGIPLPLVSYGGSALLPTMFALGMLLSFAKREPGAQAALAARGPGG
ncbi:MAG: putative lipid II flippase FtsW, partial [Carbonactinosporaceae bacterium]